MCSGGEGGDAREWEENMETEDEREEAVEDVDCGGVSEPDARCASPDIVAADTQFNPLRELWPPPLVFDLHREVGGRTQAMAGEAVRGRRR